MARVNLDHHQGRTDYFHDVVLINLIYWLSWLGEAENGIVERLDYERDNIVKAISLGLDLGYPANADVHQLLVDFSAYMERRGPGDVWQRILIKSVRVAEQSGDEEKLVTRLALLARLLYRQSRFRESMAYYRRTIRLSRKIGDLYEEARACTNLGFAFIEQEHWYRGEVLCCHALNIFAQLGSRHGVAHTHNHLGFLYTQRGPYHQAQYHLEQACAIWQERDDPHGLMLGCMNLGGLYVYMALSDQAIVHSEKAIRLAQQVGEEQELGVIYTNLGMAYLTQGDLAAAESYSLKAEQISRDFADSYLLATVQENLGKIYVTLADWEQARLYLDAASSAWRLMGYKHGQTQIAIYMAEYEFGQDNRVGVDNWLAQAENLLAQQAVSARYDRLKSQINKIRHSLNCS